MSNPSSLMAAGGIQHRKEQSLLLNYIRVLSTGFGLDLDVVNSAHSQILMYKFMPKSPNSLLATHTNDKNSTACVQLRSCCLIL